MATTTDASNGNGNGGFISSGLDEALLSSGKVSGDDLRKVRRFSAEKGERVERMLVDLGFLSEDDLLPILASYHGVPMARASEVPDEPPALEHVSVDYMRSLRILPISIVDGTLRLAMADPGDTATIEVLEQVTGLVVDPVLVRPRDLLERFETIYGEGETGGEGDNESGIEILADDEADVEHLRDMASEAPVIRLVNQTLSRAVEQRASDIHVEPFENELRVRFRIDGVLHDQDPPPRNLTAAIISRIKLMAKLNIAERRLPQDGRIKLRLVGREIDLRVSSLPTLYGESVVLRILDRSSVVVDLGRLGMPTDILENFSHMISQPHGLILVTGPTGSGKTTTLYGALDKINSPELKIITIEDPVEYQLRGVNQIHVKAQIGLSFAAGLRSIVRQDPDVIMVGEIRDAETAEIAIQAALTGHLVFSTLHTNDAAGAISRLLDMGVEDYLLASSLIGVMAQRLVRRVCSKCRRAIDASPEFLKELGPKGAGTVVIYESEGCSECAGTGYLGRGGIYELLVCDDQIRNLIVSRATADRIKADAVSRGMRTLRMDGFWKVAEGMTTVGEVLRVTQDQY
ncbi:MAG TPA: type II secretion system ATPase GspE [Candidatus Limnocylindrales bacterium]|nr:type II secretion system ATPase GspE [Candidatus Limnocylindrales bacterium]